MDEKLNDLDEELTGGPEAAEAKEEGTDEQEVVTATLEDEREETKNLALAEIDDDEDEETAKEAPAATPEAAEKQAA